MKKGNRISLLNYILFLVNGRVPPLLGVILTWLDLQVIRVMVGLMKNGPMLLMTGWINGL